MSYNIPSSSVALFAGSFDPFTCGHADIVERALKLFERVIIGVGYNEQKQGFLPVKERVEVLRQFYISEPRVSVETYQGLTVDFAQRCGAKVMLRGVRSVKDYEYELQLADVNRRLCPQVETVLLMARPELASCSSSVVRELLHFGHDISEWLPKGLVYLTLNKN